MFIVACLCCCVGLCVLLRWIGGFGFMRICWLYAGFCVVVCRRLVFRCFELGCCSV